MTLLQITREAVLAAVAEYDELGQPLLLERYGLEQTHACWFVHNGRKYDSKAIMVAAHEHVGGGALTPSDFGDGQRTMILQLRRLGFEITRVDSRRPSGHAGTSLFDVLDRLSTHRLGGIPSRHKPLALLWAIGRLAAGQPRLMDWREFRDGVTPILHSYGLPESRLSPEHPFWHLRSDGLWEVNGLAWSRTKTPPLTLLDNDNPLAGFTTDAASRLEDTAIRGRAVRTLLTRYLVQLDHTALLGDVGLHGYDTAAGNDRWAGFAEGLQGEAARREVTAQLIVRDPQIAQSVKALYDHRCQICGVRLQTRNGGYSEAAHIRGLGVPHRGPDHLANLLCLCPNDHVLFDTFTIYVDHEGVVRSAVDQSPVGTLHIHPQHILDAECLSYHRQLCGQDA
ncbi:HNH endonuclease [Catellatospora sp. TT07R-123]|uniref:HNH endonuclease n=1 Tax=Catellatospora sp. TT07R-123 TaxID=2733863 RepID=UPI001BB31D0D|nr:HNH endonuclease [Catellatospora sp. TT07R-123]